MLIVAAGAVLRLAWLAVGLRSCTGSGRVRDPRLHSPLPTNCSSRFERARKCASRRVSRILSRLACSGRSSSCQSRFAINRPRSSVPWSGTS